MKNTIVYTLLVVITVASLQGCGETIRGVGKDLSRIGKGIRTIFVS